MTSIKVILHKSWKHKEGTYPVVLQMIHNRKKKLLYTGHRVTEEDFDAALQKVSPGANSVLSARAIRLINRDIKHQVNELWKKVRTLERRGAGFSVKDFSNKPEQPDSICFLKYMSDQIDDKRKSGHYGIAEAYQYTLNSFSLFLKKQTFPVSGITPPLIRMYTDFLVEHQASPNTIAYYMRNLKTIYNRIIADGVRKACNCPFKSVRTGIGRTPKRAISREELSRIVNLRFDAKSERHLEIARDIFMFSFYCRGISFVDIILLKKKDIVSDTITYFRQKGKQPVRVSITTQMQELMDKYTCDTEYLFPILNPLSPQPLYKQYKLALKRINYGLKSVGKRAGVKYPLTTYMARHSWATLAKSLGIPVSFISEGLGHTSERTTLIYLKEIDSSTLDKINEAVSQLTEYKVITKKHTIDM